MDQLEQKLANLKKQEQEQELLVQIQQEKKKQAEEQQTKNRNLPFYIEVGDDCYETLPCQYDVTIYRHGVPQDMGRMDVDDIIQLYRDNNVPVPDYLHDDDDKQDEQE